MTLDKIVKKIKKISGCDIVVIGKTPVAKVIDTAGVNKTNEIFTCFIIGDKESDTDITYIVKTEGDDNSYRLITATEQRSVIDNCYNVYGGTK